MSPQEEFGKPIVAESAKWKHKIAESAEREARPIFIKQRALVHLVVFAFVREEIRNTKKKKALLEKRN